jgi:hypothetical protein
MTMLYLICGTLLALVWIGNHYGAKKHAATKKAEVDLKQAELASPPPERPAITIEQQLFDTKKQALNVLLDRRKMLDQQISNLRNNAMNTRVEYSRDVMESARHDALRALEDARVEQRELIQEQHRLLIMMGEANDEPKVDAAQEPVRVATGGPVAGRVDDPDQLHDAEPDEPEASRAGVA